MNSVADSFGWPFQDSGWFGKMVLQGLIAIIPIVGWIALTGWMMVTIDYYRAGRRELAPAGFHLSRGVGIFFVYVIYGIALGIPGNILTAVGNSTGSSGLTALGNLLSFAAYLFLAFLAPAIILFVYRGGFSGGFDLNGIWQTATGNLNNTLPAALVIIAGSIIGGLGAILCCVGLLFTIPYSTAIYAGVVTWYERIIAGPAPAPPPSPAGP